MEPPETEATSFVVCQSSLSLKLQGMEKKLTCTKIFCSILKNRKYYEIIGNFAGHLEEIAGGESEGNVIFSVENNCILI